MKKIYLEDGNKVVYNASAVLAEKSIAKNNNRLFEQFTVNDFPNKESFENYCFKVDLFQSTLYDNKVNSESLLKDLLSFVGCDDCKLTVNDFTTKRYNGNKVDYTTDGGLKIKALNEQIRALEYDANLSDDEKKELAKELRAQIRHIRKTEPCFENKAIWQLPPKAFREQFEQYVGAYYANTNLKADFVPKAQRDWNGGKGRKWIDKAEKHNATMLESGKPEKVINIEKYRETFDLNGLKAEVQYYWNGGNGTPDAVYGALDAIKADAEKKDAEKDAEKKESIKATKKAKK